MWRWTALWAHGGVYLDAKFGVNAPMEKWIDWDNNEFMTCNGRRFLPVNGAMAMT